MKRSLLFVLLAVCSLSFAKDKPWQDATVVGSSLAGGYWVRGENSTYVTKQSSARLTFGGKIRVYSDGKNLYVIDNERKERKCQIVKEMTNAIADDFRAKEAAKTPEQQATEQAQRQAYQLRQLEIRQQALRDYNAQHSKTKVEVQVKDCTKYPALCVN